MIARSRWLSPMCLISVARLPTAGMNCVVRYPASDQRPCAKIHGSLFAVPKISFNLLPALTFLFGRDLCVAGCSLLYVLCESGLSVSDCPPDAAAEQVDEEWIRPVLGPVTDRGEKYAPFAFHASPRHWVRRALV